MCVFGQRGLQNWLTRHTVQNNLFDYQLMQPTTGPGAMFYQFCDALEVKDGVSAPASGWGLQHAIQAWGNFWNTTYYAYCKDPPVTFFRWRPDTDVIHPLQTAALQTLSES